MTANASSLFHSFPKPGVCFAVEKRRVRFAHCPGPPVDIYLDPQDLRTLNYRKLLDVAGEADVEAELEMACG
jgi:hypothetical protein